MRAGLLVEKGRSLVGKGGVVGREVRVVGRGRVAVGREGIVGPEGWMGVIGLSPTSAEWRPKVRPA